MVEKDTVFNGKLKQKGIFNFKEFYEFLYDYLYNENYDVFETKYSEKITGDSKNIEIEWKATKEISDYFRFEIHSRWLITGLKKVNVKKDGQEISMDSGTIEIKFIANLQKDYENRWESNAFMKFLRGVYDRYVIRTRTDDYELMLFRDINEFIAQIKSFLAIEGQHSIP